MDITITEHAKSTRYVVIALRGRVTAYHTPTLHEHFQTLMTEKVNHYVLDLSHVEFLDSAGLASLVNLLKQARQEGGDVLMVLPKQEAAQRILRLTRFDKVFTIKETAEDALKSF